MILLIRLFVVTMEHKNNFVYFSALKNRKKVVNKLLALDFENTSTEELSALLSNYQTIMRDLKTSR